MAGSGGADWPVASLLRVVNGEKSAMNQCLLVSGIKSYGRNASMTLHKAGAGRMLGATSKSPKDAERLASAPPLPPQSQQNPDNIHYFNCTDPDTVTTTEVLPASTGTGVSAIAARASNAIKRGRGVKPGSTALTLTSRRV